MSLKSILQSRSWPALGQFLTTGFIFLGLPVLAWGVDDLAGFFTHPARIGFAAVVCLQAAVSGWLVYMSPPHPEQKHYFNIGRMHAYMFEIIFVMSAFGDRRVLSLWGENTFLRWAGLGIYLIGLAFSVWTNWTWVNHLRTAGETAVANPVLLFDGPYKWIRYPSMVYLAVYTLGVVFVFRSWLGLVLMLPLIGGILNRVNSLEQIYAEEYKRVWPLRRHASKRLIPYIY